MMTLIHQNKQ